MMQAFLFGCWSLDPPENFWDKSGSAARF